jgi:N-acylglucosamine 2-epimerase
VEQVEITKLLTIYRDGLLNDTLPFWTRHSTDYDSGGFFTFLQADGTRYSTDKPMWIQGRAAWLFARLFNDVEQREEWLELSRHGIDFLLQHGFDTDGRMFYLVTRDGRPLRKRRYLFTETFGAIALAEYARATGDSAILDRAKQLYRKILYLHRTPGALEPKVIPTTRSLRSHAMPMILIATSQVMRLADEDTLYEDVIADSIHDILTNFVKPELRVLLETVNSDGTFLDDPDGREVNPGHAIETSWFLMQESLRNGGQSDLLAKACQILDWSLEIGWDDKCGGLLYFRDCRGLPSVRYEHDMKLWWPHTEAIYATLLAYYATRDSRYLEWHRKIHDWAYSHFPDRVHGEWFGYLHRDGSRSTDLKGNLWKGPFHLPRMQLNCWKLLEKLSSQRSVCKTTDKP